jgi:hypothetical protein
METHAWVEAVVRSGQILKDCPPEDVLNLGPGNWTAADIEAAGRETLEAANLALNSAPATKLSAIALRKTVREAVEKLKAAVAPSAPEEADESVPGPVTGPTLSRSPGPSEPPLVVRETPRPTTPRPPAQNAGSPVGPSVQVRGNTAIKEAEVIPLHIRPGPVVEAPVPRVVDVHQAVAAAIAAIVGRPLSHGMIVEESQEKSILARVISEGSDPSLAETTLTRAIRPYRRSVIVAAIVADLHGFVYAAQTIAAGAKDKLPANTIYRRQFDDKVGVLSRQEKYDFLVATGLVEEALSKAGVQISTLDWPPDRPPKSIFQRLFG